MFKFTVIPFSAVPCRQFRPPGRDIPLTVIDMISRQGKELKDPFLPRGARGDEPGGGDHRRVAERPEQNDDKEGIILLIAPEAGDDSRGQRDVHADLRRHVIIILTEEADAFQKISEYYYKDRGESAL